MQYPSKHLSMSQFGMYRRCGQQFLLRYVEGIVSPPGFALLRGQNFHKTRDFQLSHKLEHSALPPEQDALDHARDVSVKTIEQQEIDYEGIDKKKFRDTLIDSSVVLTRLDRAAYLEEIVPKYVEEQITLEISELPVPVIGYVDCFTVDGALDDAKTTAAYSPPKADAVKHSEQLIMYSLMLMQAGEHVTRRELHYLWTPYRTLRNLPEGAVKINSLPDLTNFDGKSGPVIAVPIVETEPVTRDEATTLIRRMAAMADSVEREIFLPCDPEHWACSPKYCGYYDLKYSNGKHVCPYAYRDWRPTS